MAEDVVVKAKWDTHEIKALMRKLSGPKLHQAMSAAVNDTARQVERKAEQLTARTLGVPNKRAKLGIWVGPYSNPKTLTAVVRGSASVIPLKAFNAHEKEEGVVASLWGTAAMHPGSFIEGGAPGKRVGIGMGGHVFHRVGNARFPIEKSKGAAIAEAMAKDSVSEVNETYGAERLQTNVLRQLIRYASVHKAKSTRRSGEGKFKKR
jgi:hypothetical protein